MLIPFQSKAAGDFYMLEPHAQALLALMGKSYAAQGVIMASEIEMRLGQLQTGLEAQLPTDSSINETLEHDTPQKAVGLKQRAWPLIDMLTRAQKKNVDVVWGIDA